MSTPQTDQQANSGSALHLWVAIALALVLLVSWLMGYGPGGSKSVPAQTMADRAAATATVLPAPPQASVAAPAAAQASGPASVPAAEPVIAPVAAPTPAPESALPPAPESAPAPAPAPALAPAPGSEASAASVASASGRVVKIYFGSEKASLPQGGARSLAGVAKYLKANPGAKASVSGFHDPSGNLANNQKLAQRRAQAVALALVKLGVNKDRIVLQKPAQTTGTGKPQEARRVEVAVVAS